jgi:hypothetical protein
LTAPAKRPALRALAFVLASLCALELAYALAANAVLRSGLIQRAVSGDGGNGLAWDRAYSPWPGRVCVKGLVLRVQDEEQQFQLTVGRAVVDVVLWELPRKQFRASRVRAEGIGFRYRRKVERAAAGERAVAAFPALAGFASPALLRETPKPLEAEPSMDELLSRWSVRIEGVDAGIDDLWFQQYRYQGPARVRGGFLLAPGRLVWVGPALLELDGGALHAGDHALAPRFTARAAVTFAPYDLAHNHGLQVFRALTGSVLIEAPLADLGAADLHLDGLGVHGAGVLTARLDAAAGLLLPGSSLELRAPAVEVQLQGYRFAGEALAKLWVEHGAADVSARVTLDGALDVPAPALTVALTGAVAELSLHDTDLSAGLTLLRLRARLGEVRVGDARAVTRLVSKKIPVLAPLVLGSGPLVASLSAEVTPDSAVVRLLHAELGGARLHGAARAGPEGWSGAAAGRFAKVSFGLRLRDGKLATVPLAGAGWLGPALAAAGLAAE